MNAHTKISQQVEEAAEIAGVGIEKLTSEEAELIRQHLIKKFASEERARQGLGRRVVLWERLSDSISIQNENAWIWLDNFIEDEDVILFFNAHKEETMYHVVSGSKLSTLLGETYPFEFYLTDVSTNFLLCFNHHDYLIAVGSAKEWLRNTAKQSSSPSSPKWLRANL